MRLVYKHLITCQKHGVTATEALETLFKSKPAGICLIRMNKSLQDLLNNYKLIIIFYFINTMQQAIKFGIRNMFKTCV